jgi:hypothetical protein
MCPKKDMSHDDIVERNVCKVAPLPILECEWRALASTMCNMSRALGRSTSECKVESHLLYTTVLRLCGIGEVDDTLLRGCRTVLHRAGVTAHIQVCRTPTPPLLAFFPRTFLVYVVVLLCCCVLLRRCILSVCIYRWSARQWCSDVSGSHSAVKVGIFSSSTC